MIYFGFITVLLIYNVCGFMEYNSITPNTNTKPGESPNHASEYNAHQRMGAPIGYAQFPHLFPDHHVRLGEQYHQPYEIRPTDPKFGRMPEHVSYNFRPTGPRPDQVPEHVPYRPVESRPAHLPEHVPYRPVGSRPDQVPEHVPYNFRPVESRPGQVPEHVPYSFRPVGSRPDQATDHHFLTRPQSIISTPMGLQYMPHLINPRPFPANLNHHMERPFYQHKPALESYRPGITVFAENIFIHNENRKYPDTGIPYGWIHYGDKPELFPKPAMNWLKPEFLDKKSFLLNLLLSAKKPEKIVMENKVDVTDFTALKGPLDIFHAKPGIISQVYKPYSTPEEHRPSVFNGASTQRPMVETVEPSNKNNDISNEHTSIQKEMPWLEEFHPLLEPVEETHGDEEFSKGDEEKETTVITVTGLGNMSIETEGPENVMDNLDETEKETEN